MLKLGALLLSLAMLAGCTDDNSSIFISHIGRYEHEDEGGCTVDEDVHLIDAWFNVAFADNSYQMATVIVSQLVRRDIGTTAEPNGVIIERAEVELLNEAGQALTSVYSVAASGGVYIPPSAVGGSSQAVVPFVAIPSGVTPLLQDLVFATEEQTIVVSMRVFGRTTGGTDVESPLFTFGVRLVNRPTSSVCDSPEAREDYPLINCISGQDGAPYLDACI
jgi:hypothetical protein